MNVNIGHGHVVRKNEEHEFNFVVQVGFRGLITSIRPKDRISLETDAPAVWLNSVFVYIDAVIHNLTSSVAAVQPTSASVVSSCSYWKGGISKRKRAVQFQCLRGGILWYLLQFSLICYLFHRN